LPFCSLFGSPFPWPVQSPSDPGRVSAPSRLSFPIRGGASSCSCFQRRRPISLSVRRPGLGSTAAPRCAGFFAHELRALGLRDSAQGPALVLISSPRVTPAQSTVDASGGPGLNFSVLCSSAPATGGVPHSRFLSRVLIFFLSPFLFARKPISMDGYVPLGSHGIHTPRNHLCKLLFC
jgi:hypothetical protein